MRRLRSLPLTLVTAALAGCLAPVDELPPEDDPDELDAILQAETRPGPWTLARDVREAGDRQHVSYDDAPPWDGGAHCGGGILPGAAELATYLEATFPAIRSIGGYACRQNTADASRTSVHGTGRALDVMIPLDHGDADNGKGDPIAAWLILHAEEVGIQYIIWDRSSWGGYRDAPKLRAYTGPIPHIDHLHVELTVEAANRRTPWFSRRPPRGRFTNASCARLEGWTLDPDHPAVRLEVQLFVDGLPGAAALRIVTRADRRRDAACGGTDPCRSGFRVDTPARLLDGRRHRLRAYVVGNDGEGRLLLEGSPRELTCAAPEAPDPDPPPAPAADPADEAPAEPPRLDEPAPPLDTDERPPIELTAPADDDAPSPLDDPLELGDGAPPRSPAPAGDGASVHEAAGAGCAVAAPRTGRESAGDALALGVAALVLWRVGRRRRRAWRRPGAAGRLVTSAPCRPGDDQHERAKPFSGR